MSWLKGLLVLYWNSARQGIILAVAWVEGGGSKTSSGIARRDSQMQKYILKRNGSKGEGKRLLLAPVLRLPTKRGALHPC